MLGGIMRSLYHGWKWSGGRLCPYRTAWVLGEDYRPLDDPEAAPRPPSSHRRVRNIVLAFAGLAETESIERLGAGMG